jgi:hypothetical protein
MKNFRPLFIASIIVALCAFGVPWLVRPWNMDAGVTASGWLALFWFAMVIVSFVRFRRRGWWFLLPTPLAFFWLFGLFLIAWGCAHNIRACP